MPSGHSLGATASDRVLVLRRAKPVNVGVALFLRAALWAVTEAVHDFDLSAVEEDESKSMDFVHVRRWRRLARLGLSDCDNELEPVADE